MAGSAATIEQTQAEAGMEAWAATVAGAPRREAEGELAEGARLGRYVVVGVLGQGGMGVVYAGYDPELDRRVALKLLFGSGSEEARLRTLREAQAMARLQHPNVVTVHDVGSAAGQVWVAMELVQGQTLRGWSAQQARGWREVLGVMLAAAAGLGAAHAAGLVHRDVKPENIMIGDDGRVRVMDFGLARAEEGAPAAGAGEAGSLLSSELTCAGSLVGTPAYMAPEGLRGVAGGVRGDVFSWCVTCWEALYGERPFAGVELGELRRNVGLGRRRAPPAGSKVPAEVRRALERGLEVDPGRRYGSFEALSAAIEGALRGRRRRALAAGALMLSLGAGGVVGGRAVQAEAAAAECAAAGATIAAVWDEGAARRLAGAFAATGRGDAAEVFTRTRPWLDAYAAAWAAARAERCLAEQGRGAAAVAVEEGLACLEERRAGFAALVEEVLMKADARGLDRAVAAASRLPPVGLCGDPAWLARAPRRPAEVSATAVVAVRVALERSAALERAGRYEEAVTAATAALAEATALGWAPLVTEARLRRAGIDVWRAEYAAAEAELEAVVWEAAATGYDAVVAEAAHDLSFAVGIGLGRPAEGARWGRLGVAALSRSGAAESLAASNNYAALAIVQESRGELAEAQALKEKVLALRERHLGREHPSVGNALNMIGALHLERGDVEAALAAHERALAIRLATLGPRHVEVATSYVNLGLVHYKRGEAGRCVELEAAAREIFTAVHGPEHPEVATTLENQASCELALGDAAGALARHQAALALRERALGGAHPYVGVSWAGVGDALRASGELEEAAAAYAKALAILEAAHGAESAAVAATLGKLALVRGEAGRWAEAVGLLERAQQIRAGRALPGALAAELDFRLGQALWATGAAESEGRARGLIGGAVATVQAARAPEIGDAAEIAGWLARHKEALGEPPGGR